MQPSETILRGQLRRTARPPGGRLLIGRWRVRVLLGAAALSVGLVLLPSGGAHAETANRLYLRALGLDEMRAIPLLVRAHKMAPRDARISYRLGFVYQKMSRLTQAEEFYQKTLRLRKCHVKALNNLAGLRLDQRRDPESKELYLRAVRCRGSYYLPYYNLGGMLLAEGHIERAAALFAEALKRSPDHASSHHNLGIAYEKLARKKPIHADAYYEKARKHLRRSCELDPRDALNHFNYGRLLYNLRELDEAERILRRTVALARSSSRLRGRSLKMISGIQTARRADEERRAQEQREAERRKAEAAKKENGPGDQSPSDKPPGEKTAP